MGQLKSTGAGRWLNQTCAGSETLSRIVNPEGGNLHYNHNKLEICSAGRPARRKFGGSMTHSPPLATPIAAVKYFIQVCTDTATKALECVLENYSIFNTEARKIIVELKKKLASTILSPKRDYSRLKSLCFTDKRNCALHPTAGCWCVE